MSARWTGAEDDGLRALALTGCGAANIARKLGRTTSAVENRASALRVSVVRKPATYDWRVECDTVRARWATLIGPMKERLRADIAEEGRRHEL